MLVFQRWKQNHQRKTQLVFFDLVVIARAKHPIPSRTRPLSAAALMVLRLKTWESKSLPNLIKLIVLSNDYSRQPSTLAPVPFGTRGFSYFRPALSYGHMNVVLSSVLHKTSPGSSHVRNASPFEIKNFDYPPRVCAVHTRSPGLILLCLVWPGF